MRRLDLRSLALYRVGLASVYLWNLFEHLQIFALFFGDGGVYKFEQGIGSYPWLSPFYLSSDLRFQFTLMSFAVLSGFALLLGYRTRLFSIACWFFTLSLQHYARLSFFSGDDVLRLLQFWSLFLPLGATFSLDEWRAKRNDGFLPRQASYLASIALTSQISALFIAAGYHKLMDRQWLNGEGVQKALLAHGTSFGELWLSHDGLLRALGYAVPAVQILAPLLLFGSSPFIAAGVVALILFQFSLGATMELSFFPIITIVGLLALIPTSVWLPRKSDRNLPSGGLTPARVLVVFTVLVLIPNLSAPKGRPARTTLERATKFVGLDQDWSMFAPLPAGVSWLVLKATLPSKRVLDLSTLQDFTSWRTALTAPLPARIRWAALINHLTEDPELILRLAKSTCKLGASAPPAERFEEVDIFLVTSSLEAMRLSTSDVSAVQIVSWNCSKVD